MKPVKFYLVTDTHYFENNLGAGGEAFEKNIKRLNFVLTELYILSKLLEPL